MADGRALAADGKHLSFKTLDHSQRELGLYLSDREGSDVKRLLTETDPAWVNVNDDLYFLRDGHFLWASERDGFMHLHRYAGDGTLVNQVTRGDWPIVSSHGGAFWVHQGVVGIDQARNWIYFTALKDGSVERQLYRIDSDGSGLKRISTEPGTHAIEMSPDATLLFDSLLENPYSSNVSCTLARRLEEHRSTTAQSFCPRLAVSSLSTIPAADGFAMPAQVLKPKGFDPTHRYPVILHVYGGPFRANS